MNIKFKPLIRTDERYVIFGNVYYRMRIESPWHFLAILNGKVLMPPELGYLSDTIDNYDTMGRKNPLFYIYRVAKNRASNKGDKHVS